MKNIFKRGISLKEFAKLQALGDTAPENKQTAELLLKKSDKQFKTVNILEMKFTDFLDCERFIEESNFKDFCNIFVRRKFWQKIYVHNLESILTDYANQKKEMCDRFYYVFDPPQYSNGELTQATQGDELRKEFVQEFGSWVVLTDVICQKQNVSYKELEQWKMNDFLFWASYYSGQKIVENVK